MERWPLAVLALLSLCVLCSAEDASKYIDSERAVDLLPFLRVMAHEGFATHAVFNYSARYHPERVMEAMRRPAPGGVTGFARDPHDVFAFLLKSEGQGWEELLQQIASVHALAWGHPIAVMISPSTTEDQISHLELLSHVTVHRAMVRHKRLFYLPPRGWGRPPALLVSGRCRGHAGPASARARGHHGRGGRRGPAAAVRQHAQLHPPRASPPSPARPPPPPPKNSPFRWRSPKGPLL